MVLNLFKCKHPFSSIGTEKIPSTEVLDADFIELTTHLFCMKCGDRLSIKNALLIGGLKKFLGRIEESK